MKEGEQTNVRLVKDIENELYGLKVTDAGQGLLAKNWHLPYKKPSYLEDDEIIQLS
jgi:hypothetical protein